MHFSLTRKPKNNNNEIKDIPDGTKVVYSQSNDFHNCLQCEDHNEHAIHYTQAILYRFSLLVMIDSHSNHVQEDKQHNAHFKSAAHSNFVKGELKFVLKNIHE